MKVQRLPRYRVAIPLSGRCVHVVASSPEEAVSIVLADTDMLKGRDVKKHQEGNNWTFWKVDPPIPSTWLGDAPTPTSPVNPKKGVVTCIETEYKGEMLVSVPTEVKDE